MASSKPKYEENRPSWIFITGGSRGIGRAIALKAPADGANVVIAAKTNEPHPKLPETIQTVAREIEAIGGKALPLQLDVRRDDDIRVAVAKAAKAFGGIDILVNNASALNLSKTPDLPMNKFDLMLSVNHRGTFDASLPSVSISSLESARPRSVAAARSGARLVWRALRLHDLQVWHEHVRPRYG